MNKVHVRRFLRVVALVVPIVLVVLFLQSYVFVFRDANSERIAKFYCEEKDSLDVVIIGASEVTAGYAPGYAYGKYGYTSYMYAMDGNVGSLYTAELKEILSRQKPGLILVEAYGFTNSQEALDSEAKLRYFIENIPESSNKLTTIQNFNYDNKISCLFPFMKYHGNFDVAKNQMRYLYYNYMSMSSPSYFKGMTTQTVVHSGPGDEGLIDGNNGHINDDCKNHLITFLEYCRKENLDNVVFVNFPRYIQDEEKNDLLSRVGEIQQIVREYGFDFLDLQKEKDLIGLDVQNDFYNSHHLNIYGQQKVTSYIGDWVMNKYQITPKEQSQANQAHWQECADLADQYFAYANEAILSGEELYFALDADTFRTVAP